MASAKEENKRKQKESQKRKQYLIDFLLYVELDKEKVKHKSDIAFYDDYGRIFGWINYEIRQASIKPLDALPLNIPDEVINNFVIREPGKDQERVERKFRKSKKGKNYYDNELLEHITTMLGLDPKVQEFYYKYPTNYIAAAKILSIEQIEDGDGKRERKRKSLKMQRM